MKSQTEVLMAAELAVCEVEKMLDITRPDITQYELDINDIEIYDSLIREVRLIIEVLFQKKIITKFKLIDLVKHYYKTRNIFTIIMIEVDYFNEISSMENIDELIKIRDIPRFHLIHSKARRKKCNDRIDEVNIDKITAASQLLLDKDKTDFGIHTIELILANCSIGNAYNLGVNKLIPHYKCEINKLNTGHEIESYLTDIESRKNIILSYTDEGLKFLIYCNNKTESLKIENDIETKITDYSNENVLQAYDSIIDNQFRFYFLSKCLTEFKKLDNTDGYWFIYRELLRYFPDSNLTEQAYNKLVSAFIKRTVENNSYQTVYNIFHYPHEGEGDKVSENLTKNESILNLITECMKIASLYQLEISVVQFCYSNNEKIYRSLIDNFFSKAPSAINVRDFEKELLSIKKILNDFDKISKYFHRCMDDHILKSVINFNIYEVYDYLLLTKDKPDCHKSRRSLIQKVAEASK